MMTDFWNRCVSFAAWRQRMGQWLLAVLLLVGGPATAQSVIDVVTEEFPPYNFTEQGRLTGFSTEVVQAVLRELKLEGRFQSLPWARAYSVAQGQANTLIYSIGRTPEREHRFKWVGVIAPADYYLFSLKRRNLQLNRLEDAKRFQIGTVNEDVGEQFLIRMGFAKGVQLQSSSKYEVNYEKLKLGRVDLWIMPELGAHYLARLAGDDPAVVLAKTHHIANLGADGYYMAFGPRTPDALVNQFRAGLAVIKRQGVYDALKRKWL